MADVNAYNDFSFGSKYNIPSIPPHYLIIIISMILRNSDDEEVKNIISKDPLLTETIYRNGGYDKQLILVLVRMIQQGYGIEFNQLGHFLKGVSFSMEEYQRHLFFESISLIWNYSPVISPDGNLNVRNTESTSSD